MFAPSGVDVLLEAFRFCHIETFTARAALRPSRINAGLGGRKRSIAAMRW
jgi:hypothetical protein